MYAAILADMKSTCYIENMQHFNRYVTFIMTRKMHDEDVYTEKHHVFPRSLCNFVYVNDYSNLIRLTAREHFIAHMLLWKALGGGMTNAFMRLANCGKYTDKGITLNAKQYAVLRENFATYSSKLNKGRKRPESAIIATALKNTGKHRTEELKQRMSSINKGQKHSATQDQRQSEFIKGRIWVKKGTTSKQVTKEEVNVYLADGYKLGRYLVYSAETLCKISEASAGRFVSEATKQKLIVARVGTVGMRKGTIKRRVPKDKVAELLLDGYILGWK